MPASLSPLVPKIAGVRIGVESSYRLLQGAHASVSGLFDAVDRLSRARRNANSSQVGAMKRDEEDVVRSAIVMAGSGLDAAMSRLVSDAGPLLVRVTGTGARAQYVEDLKRELPKNHVASLLRDTLIFDDPTDALLRWWVTERTRASFQGTSDLKERVRSGLGINARTVSDATIDGLEEFFTARNQIVHEMDYTSKNKPKTVGRRRRKSEDAAALCDAAFDVSTRLINAAGALIQKHVK